MRAGRRGGEGELFLIPAFLCGSSTESIYGRIRSLSRVSSEEFTFNQIELWPQKYPAINQVPCFCKREKYVGNENVSGRIFKEVVNSGCDLYHEVLKVARL